MPQNYNKVPSAVQSACLLFLPKYSQSSNFFFFFFFASTKGGWLDTHSTPSKSAPPYKLKAGVHMKTSEIRSNIERELLGLKWKWKHYQTVDPLQKEPQVRSGLFGIRLLILHFKFQFSKSIKSSTFYIFLNLTYPLRKNISFPKHPKITPKFTQNRQIVVNEISRGI